MEKRKQNEIDASKIKIESGVPKQKWKNGGRANKWFYIFSKMNVDDSFAVPYEEYEQARRIQGTITAGVRWYRKHTDPNFKVSTQILFIKKEVRIWRDK